VLYEGTACTSLDGAFTVLFPVIYEGHLDIILKRLRGVHGVVVFIPATQRNVAVKAGSKIIATLLGSVNETCTGHLNVCP
jgi:hypothetical protein